MSKNIATRPSLVPPESHPLSASADGLEIALGGMEAEHPYDPKTDLHRGKGDVSNLPSPTVLTPEQHEASAQQALAAASKSITAPKRGAQK